MPAARTDRPPVRIIQCAREIGGGFGVGGPAERLEEELRRLGAECERLTLADLGVSRRDGTPAAGPLRATARLWRDVLVFSVLGTALLWWRHHRRRDPRTVTICHVDALAGDVFVVRSLHKAYLRRTGGGWARLLRNPLHLFVLGREAVRFRFGIHRAIVALSPALAREVAILYGVDVRSITIIPNGVDLERFRPSVEARAEVRRELGLGERVFVLLFVANELERKGLHPLLSALRLLRERGIDACLVVAGAGSPAPFRRELDPVRAHVRFVGHRDDVERFYAAADVFALPTLHDISPLVGPEALASGLPLLMTDVGGIRDFLRDGENGYLVTTDPRDIAARAEELARDPERRHRMSRAARASVNGNDWASVARRYLELAEQILAEGAAISRNAR